MSFIKNTVTIIGFANGGQTQPKLVNVFGQQDKIIGMRDMQIALAISDLNTSV
jgi:hypothetical protein